jgi:hypothetical protein
MVKSMQGNKKNDVVSNEKPFKTCASISLGK